MAMDIEEVAAYVAAEGLGYAVMDGFRAEEIEDEMLRTLWAAASGVLHAIDKILDPYIEE